MGEQQPHLCLSHPQTQLPQQKLQLQEACARKEKSMAVLEHQLVEVEVRALQGRPEGGSG